jgi:protein phosphatase PTC1
VGIFDGHGGDSAARWCGEHFGACLKQALLRAQPGNEEEAISDAYALADSYLTGEHDIYSGCTAVTCLLLPPSIASTSTSNSTLPSPHYRLITANCGDARAVLWYSAGRAFSNLSAASRDGQAVRLTYDHKGSDPQEQQRVREAGGFIINDRVSGMLAITRALGDAELKDVISGAPYTTSVTLNPSTANDGDLADGDGFVVIACDGLWDVVSDQTVVDFVLERLKALGEQYTTHPNTLDTVCEHLVDMAIQEGSTDNLSVCIVRFLRPKTNDHGKAGTNKADGVV